jgi:hypothetical protein
MATIKEGPPMASVMSTSIDGAVILLEERRA